MNTFPAVRCIALRHARLSRFKRLAFAFAASIVLFLPLTGATLLPATQVDSVMVIDGIPGDSKLLPDAINISSFDYGVSSDVTVLTDPNGMIHWEITDFTVIKPVDRSSPLLKRACVIGQHFPKITLYVRKNDGDTNAYLMVTLEDVVITSVHMTSDLEGGKESVSLKFGKITESALGEFAPATFVLFTI